MGDYPRFADEVIETMPRAGLEQLQEARLVRMVAFAYDNAPLIREAWDAAGVTPADICSLDDFRSKAPFVDKDSVRRFRDTKGDPCGGLKAVADEELHVIATTSGTTGDPTPILVPPRALNHVGMMRDYWHIGVRPGDYVQHAIFTFRGGSWRWPFHEMGWKSILASHSPAEVPRIFEASLRFRPTLLMTVSSPLLFAFEQELERTGVDPKDIFASYKGAMFGGEFLGNRQRALAEEWGLPLYEMGSVGDGLAGHECSARDGFHAWEDMVFVENLDPNGDQPVSEGEIGELVITMLTDRFNPMIRFRTDDLVTVDSKPCSCGRTHARVRLLGRKSDRVLVDGIAVMPKQVQAVVETYRAARAGLFQFVRPTVDMDHLWLRIGYEAGLLDGTLDAFEEDLCGALEATLGVTVRTQMVPIEDLLKLGPPHKIPRMTRA